MRAAKQLPEHYHRQAALDLSKSTKAIVGAIALGIVLLIALGWLLVQYTRLLRPAALEDIGFLHILTITSEGTMTFELPFFSALVAFALVVLIHELVHGLFFWRFAGQRPGFGVKGLLFYVAAPPGVYFPRNQYLIVGIAPLLLLTLVGLLLMLVVPPAVIPILSFFIVFNAAGAAGDLIMVVRLASFSPATLMLDSDTGVVVYGPESTSLP